MEGVIHHSTDASSEHLFIENPSIYFPSQTEMNIVVHRKVSDSNFKTTNFGDVEEQKTSSLGRNVGVAAGLDLGGGLGVSLNHQLLEMEEINTHTDRGDREYLETFKSHYTSVKVSVELTESIFAGIRMGVLNEHNEIIGSFRASSSEFTRFSTSMIGTGGGLSYHQEKISVGGSYLPPMKGKSEVYSEEKLVTSPGVAEFSGSLQNGDKRYGFSLKRWIYKFDDRFLGTTLNDADQTPISLYGINITRNFFYNLDQKKFGAQVPLKSDVLLKASVSKVTFELNQNLEQNLPGQRENAPQYSYYYLQSLLGFQKGNLDFVIGLNVIYDKTFSYTSGSRRFDYDESGYDLIGGVFSKI